MYLRNSTTSQLVTRSQCCSSSRNMELTTSIVMWRETRFIRCVTLGSHYPNFFKTWECSQVFVFNKRNYQHIKERLKSRGVLSLSKSDLYNFFAPWFAEHLGSVRCASGNSTVERWAGRKLKLSYYLFTYNSLLKLHGSSSLLKALDDLLGNEAILQLELKSLAVAIKDPDKRKWFQIILDNTLKLWEVNMS